MTKTEQWQKIWEIMERECGADFRGTHDIHGRREAWRRSLGFGKQVPLSCAETQRSAMKDNSMIAIDQGYAEMGRDAVKLVVNDDKHGELVLINEDGVEQIYLDRDGDTYLLTREGDVLV